MSKIDLSYSEFKDIKNKIETLIQKNMKISKKLGIALILAKSFDLKDAEEWITKELKGYKKGDIIPDYRVLPGIKVMKGIGYPIKELNGSHKNIDISLGNSIPDIETLIRSNSSTGYLRTDILLHKGEMATLSFDIDGDSVRYPVESPTPNFKWG